MTYEIRNMTDDFIWQIINFMYFLAINYGTE